ncbi:class I mannose-6-phosphate isomerase [Streptomyces sp. NPDC004031]
MQPHRYEANPRYPVVGGDVLSGWEALAALLPDEPLVLAVDGPAAFDWGAAAGLLTAALTARGPAVVPTDVRDHLADWQSIVERTGSPALADDPDFDRLAAGTLADLFDELPAPEPPAGGVALVYGPGAALVPHDVLWYADAPKRFAEASVVAGTAPNLGRRPGAGRPTTKRLFYVDWPLLDRHRDTLAEDIDCWIDCQDLAAPAAVTGEALRATARALAHRPFRTRPTFNTTSWGGHWAQRELGMNPDARNTALGYELIAPESGVLVGAADAAAEIPFQLLVALHPGEILGAEVHEVFGTSFPVRFDYLDTAGGGSLSVHCHPRSDYMRDVFGWPYTQHETYYVMVGGEHNTVYLGLRGDADLDAFRHDAQEAHHHEKPFDIERYVQTHPAEPHQLFVIPAGTPHGSGAGNVVLEVSATPYLYSLRFYDWLRRDAEGRQRPVHLTHAFDNLATGRTGEAVPAELVPAPRTLRTGRGWREELLGALPEMFFEVRRLVIEGGGPAEDDTAGRFHILNVVEGEGVVITTESGDRHRLAYAETLVVPASVGRYTLSGIGGTPVRLVKSLVRR